MLHKSLRWSTASMRHNAPSTKVIFCDQAIFFTRHSQLWQHSTCTDHICMYVVSVYSLHLSRVVDCHVSVVFIIILYCLFHLSLFFVFLLFFCASVYLAAWLLRNSKRPRSLSNGHLISFLTLCILLQHHYRG